MTVSTCALATRAAKSHRALPESKMSHARIALAIAAGQAISLLVTKLIRKLFHLTLNRDAQRRTCKKIKVRCVTIVDE